MRPPLPASCFVLGLAALGMLATVACAQDLAGVDAAVPVPAPADDARHAQALLDRDAYQHTITTREARQGVYSLELSETYVGLGTTLHALDEDEQAAEAFGKALQALRIGFGLDDLRQVPVLEQLRATNEKLRNWEEVDAANHLLFYVVKHNPEATQDLRVKSLRELGRWIRRAASERLLPEFTANADDLLKLYNAEITSLETIDDYEGKSMHLASLYIDLASTELSEARRKYSMPISEFPTPGAGDQRTIVTTQCFSAVDRSGRTVQACNEPVELPNLNYYLAPNVQKSTQIRMHLMEAENRVLQASRALQQSRVAGDDQAELVDEMQRLTGEYNAFVALNKTRPF